MIGKLASNLAAGDRIARNGLYFDILEVVAAGVGTADALVVVRVRSRLTSTHSIERSFAYGAAETVLLERVSA